ncbi:MAG: phenylalanine--tRNA ligase beta subunit-related protein [Nanoarchaeota archaeon]|nr:hypothetical protein [Nanoarchaeota archaeon]MBU1632008.1 hypothetical protein [Nanoarchaeota archaeon]MBU1875623.1 hypothetical protein [Nanoarchaeota archaeon]
MKIQINKEVFSKFNQDLKIVFILAKHIDNQTRIEESKHLLNDVENEVRLIFNKENIKSHHLISPWAVAQQEFGPKARHYHTSLEKLLIKVLNKKKIVTKSVLTNIINSLALKHIIPFGIDDLENISGNLTFAIAESDKKVNILKRLSSGELYYHDSKNILGKKLDYWKNSKTFLTNKSTSALIHFEILPPITKSKMDMIIKEADSLVRAFCNGKTKVFVLDKKNNSQKI